MPSRVPQLSDLTFRTVALLVALLGVREKLPLAEYLYRASGENG
jgi:hypothetical protein